MNSFKRVSDWNKTCAKLPLEFGTEKYWQSLEKQVERIQEELDETKKAIAQRDTVELLDGAVDLDVVVNGLAYLHGMDHEAAFELVCENNDEKFTEDFGETFDALTFYNEKLGEGKVEIVSSIMEDGKTYYSLHHVSDDKIMKFPNHPKVNLAPLAKPVK